MRPRKTPWFSPHRDMTQDRFERDDGPLRLTNDYQSKIKTHLGHLPIRREKPYHIRLSQFLTALHGEQA
ncbi:hypothetical protein [Nocardia brasiliensis]|uniref:hypothetical protein n=1 Tax=Nocardia brasiliensis TaxID=37326 RepID=UPI001895E31E|nr:hypothetical protein [Nocardia brasiliensis]MBF6125049.1 hypothetical protein [Nocardia brasiliensis]